MSISKENLPPPAAELGDSEAMALLASVHHMPTGVLIVNPEGQIEYANKRIDQILSLPLSTMTRQSVFDACYRNCRLFCEMIKGAVKAKRGWQGEIDVQRPNGEVLWVSLSISPVIQFDGEVTHFVIVGENSTENKNLLLELKASEESYRTIFNHVGVAIWVQDFSAVRAWILQMKEQGVTDFISYFKEHPDRCLSIAGMVKVVDVNDFSLKLFGARSKSQLTGPLDRQCRPDTLKTIPGMVQTIADGRTNYETETTTESAQGERLHVAVGMSFPRSDESFDRVLVTIQDISARIRAKQEAQRMRRFLFSIVDNIPLMIFVKDARDFRMVYWNKYGEYLTGISRHDLIGTTDFDHWPEEQARAFRAADERVVQQRTLVDIPEESLRSADGKIRLLHTRKTVLLDESDQPEYLLGISEDITESKREEQKRQELEREVSRSRQLESVGSLAAGIAHEINTPIQFVGDNVRFLAESIEALLAMGPALYRLVEGVSDPETRRRLNDEFKKLELDADIAYLREEIPLAIEQTLDGVQRVATIVRAMKDFAPTGDRGYAAVDINKTLESTLTVARNEYKYVADVVVEYDDNLPFVECIQSELNQVWLNLVINAAHAIADKVENSEERGTITVTTGRNEENVIVRISDTGCGIPEDIRARVWDHFFTTKEVGRGTGQGLTIVSSIVDRHEGSITFESEEHLGTTFIITLPLRHEQPDHFDNLKTNETQEDII